MAIVEPFDQSDITICVIEGRILLSERQTQRLKEGNCIFIFEERNNAKLEIQFKRRIH
jgi:hypothetical protein